VRASRMCAAILAAVIAAFLSLGGASFVLAGGPQGNGGGNGNGHAQGEGSAAPAAAPAPAPAPSSGKAKSNNGGGQQKHAAAAPQSQPAPAQPKHVSTQAPSAPTSTGGGSHSTATSGPGSSAQGCDGSHNSNTGHGANHSGPYDNTCDGSPSGNGNGNGKATGKPCAGCVGNADDKNPKGQYPNGSDHNAGYECDRNHGIGRTNPAHTGCRSTTTTPPPCTKKCGGEENGCTTNCGGPECTDTVTNCEKNKPQCTDKLDTALTHSAALALKVLALLHPELTKLSDVAGSTADANCGGGGHTPVTVCHLEGNGSYHILTSDDDSLPAHLAHGDIYPVPAGGCPAGLTAGEHHGCPTDMKAGGTDNGCGTCPTDMSGGNAGNNTSAGCGSTPATVLGTASTPTTPTPNEQAVLGVRQSGSTAPAGKTAPATNEVLGTQAAGGTAPAAATAPAAVNRALPAAKAGGNLPFTGTDAMLVLFLGCLLVLGGVALHTVTTRRSTN
jgi:hypothetical protein